MTSFYISHKSPEYYSIDDDIVHYIDEGEVEREVVRTTHTPLAGTLTKISGLSITNDSFELVESSELILEPENTLEVQCSNGFDDGSDITGMVEATEMNAPVVTMDAQNKEDFLLSLGTADHIKGFYSTQSARSISYSSNALWLYEYDVNADSFNSSLLHPGYFDYEESLSFSYYTGISSIELLMPTISMDAKNSLFIYRNNDSITEYLQAKIDNGDLTTEQTEAKFHLVLACSNETVSISGGSGYVVGETFVVGNSAKCDVPAIYSIKEVDEDGAILRLSIDFSGENFFDIITLDDIVYSGDSGVDATIEVFDEYSPLGISIVNNGMFYSNIDALAYTTDGYLAVLNTWDFILKLPRVNIDFQDTKFRLKKVVVKNPGYAHELEPVVTIKNSKLNSTDYIVANKNNFVTNNDFSEINNPLYVNSNRSYFLVLKQQ